MAWKPLTVTGLIGFSLLVVGHTAPPRGVYSLIPGSCEDVMLHGNWDSARVIKVTGLRFEHEPGLSRWVSITGGLPWRLSDKESACDAGDPDSIPESGRYPGEGSVGKISYSGCRGHVPGPERGRWEVRASPANSHKEIKPQFYKELDSADTWKLPEPLTRAQPATP